MPADFLFGVLLTSMPLVLAMMRYADAPSEHSNESVDNTGNRRSPMSLALREGNTAVNVAELERSRATSTGNCSADSPALAAGVPRVFDGRGKFLRCPLNDSKK